MQHTSVRLSNEQINFLMKQAEENSTSFSEQLRDSLDAYIKLYMKIQEGHFICSFKSPNKQGFYKIMNELERMQDSDLEVNEYLKALKTALQFDYGMKATLIVPDELVQLSGCRQYMNDED